MPKPVESQFLEIVAGGRVTALGGFPEEVTGWPVTVKTVREQRGLLWPDPAVGGAFRRFIRSQELFPLP